MIVDCNPQIINLNKDTRFQFVINEAEYFLLKKINTAIMIFNLSEKVKYEY
jgi:hypothetical protein